MAARFADPPLLAGRVPSRRCYILRVGFPDTLLELNKGNLMRRQGRELVLMALYAIDGLPSFERQQALTRFWQMFSSPAVWEAMFETPSEAPHPLEQPPLWEAFDLMQEVSTMPPAQFRAAREFATSRLAGILEHLDEIDAAIRKASRSWPLHRMPQVDRSILRQGVYELLFCPDVPPAAAINEAIEISKCYADRQSRSFINGILDRVYQTTQKS